jgi:Uma2 family endonuclease
MLAAVNPTATIALQLRPVVELSDDAFIALSALNPHLRLERSAAGEIVIMSPTGAATSHRNAELTTALHTWARADGSGQAFDATVGVRLPNGAIRGPDASWIAQARLATVPSDERERFLPVCPDFMVELRSPTDDPGDPVRARRDYGGPGRRGARHRRHLGPDARGVSGCSHWSALTPASSSARCSDRAW